MHRDSKVLAAFRLAALALPLVAAGCSSNTSSSSSASTISPTPATSTETFSGSIAQLGTSGFSFTVASSGTVTIGLTAVAPLGTMALGVGITTWDGTACAATTISKNDNARAGSTALSGVAAAGSYCVSVYDSGNVAEGTQVSFTVQVAHP